MIAITIRMLKMSFKAVFFLLLLYSTKPDPCKCCKVRSRDFTLMLSYGLSDESDAP